ncbi:hypothetical protein M9Y10_043220 [Tritrichomonas musculus]|uniref:Surface antigen BspA-like n=1 Tax=Tritrichomonas musculus TaxID=1915356 RepID=A0ABR2JZ25_9EUKA
MKKQKRNVPEFQPPNPKFIESAHNKDPSISEANLKETKIIKKSIFQNMHSNYIYEINFSKDSQLQKICDSSFSLLHLYSITFPPSLQIIMPDSFKGCHFLEQIQFTRNDSNGSFIEICDDAFKDTKIQSIIIPENTKFIGSTCFPKTLKKIEFENGSPKLERIGNNAFCQTQIETFFLPTQTDSFIQPKNTFLNCRKLKTIIFDSFINKNEQLQIDYEEEKSEEERRRNRKLKYTEKVQNLSNLSEKVVIENEEFQISQDFAQSLLLSQTRIEKLDIIFSNLNFFYFFNTKKLTSISIPKSANTRYVKLEGCLYTKDMKKLIVAERNIKNAVVSSKCQIITNYAFNVKSLEKVSFEKNSELQEISFLAFYESSINDLDAPDTVDLIDYACFYKCKKLEAFKIPHSMNSLDFFTFSYTRLTQITIPKNIVKICYGCFLKCLHLNTVLFEDESNLIEIDDFAFSSTRIESISIPKSVKRIGNYCFYNCRKLKSIEFDKNAEIKKIGFKCFEGTRITEGQLIDVFQKIDTFLTREETNCDYYEGIGMTYFIRPTILNVITQVFIPSKVEEIGFHAFFNCVNLTKVNIIDISNSKLRSISKGAFCNCISLSDFKMPKTVKYVGQYSFKKCQKLNKKIILINDDDDEIVIEKNSFEDSGIISFKVKSSEIVIKNSAFKNCKNLVELMFKVNEKCVFGKSAFMNCKSLKSVLISKSVQYIKMGKECFMNSSIQKFEFPINLKKIPNFCFKFCNGLSEVTIPENSQITRFEDESFYESSITKIFIPPQTKIIKKSCFENCKKLKEVTFSNEIKRCSLEMNAFYMSGIESLIIPTGIKKIGKSCFENCVDLKSLTFSEDIKIKKINDMAFKSSGVEEVILPSSIKFIGRSSFQDCKNLKIVIFFNFLTEISPFSFSGCDSIQIIQFNSSIQFNVQVPSLFSEKQFSVILSQSQIDQAIIDSFFVGDEPVFNDTRIINYVNSVIINEKYHFNSSFELVSDSKSEMRINEFLNGGFFSVGRDTIFFCDYLVQELKIPKETQIIESNAFRFSSLKKIEFPDDSQLKIIKDSAFRNLQIEEISIPDSVVFIGESAFSNCPKLKKVGISYGSQLKEIGSFAFERTPIESFLFPFNLTTVESFAFSECFQLKTVENYSNEIVFEPHSFYRSGIESILFPQNSVFLNSSFKECSNLKEITFSNPPEKVIFGLDSFAFTGLESLKIDYLCEIHDNAFSFCNNLKEVVLIGNEIKYSINSFNCSNIESLKAIDQDFFFSDSDLVQNIVNYTLLYNLRYLNLDSRLTFENHCFVLNGELIFTDLFNNDSEEIKNNEIFKIPENVKKLNCFLPHVKKIQWPQNCIIENIGGSYSWSYSSLVEITIPKFVDEIPPHLFHHCHFLKVVQFEEGSILSKIGEYAFSDTCIEKVVLPYSVYVIKKSAFAFNFHLKEVVFNGEVIEEEAFFETGITEFSLSNNTEKIEASAFQFCRKLKTFVIDIENSGLKEIGPRAFAETAITEINIPPNVTSIKEFTFSGCNFLKEVKISNNSNLESVGQFSFAGDLSLEKVNLPKTVKSLSYTAFINTPSLRSIMKQSGQSFNVLTCNAVYSKDETLVFVPRNLKQFRLNLDCSIIHSGAFCGPAIEKVEYSDSSLICIEKCGFAHSTNLKRITIPSSVKKIEEEAFIGCSSLKTVKFQSKSGIRKIPKYCFAFCALKSIKLPDSIEVIDDSSFLSCNELHEVNLFETKVKFIGDSAFFNTSIEKVVFPPTIQFIENHAFENIKTLNIVDFSHSRVKDWSGLIELKTVTDFKSKSKKKILKRKRSTQKVVTSKSANTSPIKPSSSLTISSHSMTPQKNKKEEKVEVACYVDESSFCNSSVKVFKMNQEGYKWFNFFDKCIEIGECIVNKDIHLFLRKVRRENIDSYSLHELFEYNRNKNKKTSRYSLFNIDHAEMCKVRKEIPPDHLLGNTYKMTNIEWKTIDMIEWQKERPDSTSEKLCPFHFLNTTRLTKIKLTNCIKIKCIPKCCFAYTCLDEITIPESVLRIKKAAFKFCNHLEKVTFLKDSKLKKIESAAFYECNKLSTISIPDNVEIIPFKCFAFSGLQKVTFPDSIIKVESMAFSYCNQLKTVILNEGLFELCDLSFANNNSLESISLPDSLIKIKSGVFMNCMNLKNVNFTSKSKLFEICDCAFENTSIEELTISPSVQRMFEPINMPKLNKISFHEGNNLKFVKFEDGTIYERIEEKSTNREPKEIEKSLKLAEENPVYYYGFERNALDIVLLHPKSFKLIFAPKNLTSLKIHENCYSIGNSVFDGMTKLTSIEYTKGSSSYISDFPSCYHYINKIKTVKISSDFAFMTNKIFMNFNSLEVIEFDENCQIMVIPMKAFYGCKNLQKIIIPMSCIVIEKEAFKNCTNLKAVDFGKANSSYERDHKLKIIGNEAFSNCSSLTSIIIPQTIFLIENAAFKNCVKLKKIEIGTKYLSPENKSLVHVICSKDQLKEIGSNAFYNCSSLVSFRVPQSCLSIGKSAFMDCKNLSKISFKKPKLKTILPRTFYNCTSLTSFKICDLAYQDNYVDEIQFSVGTDSFMNCSSLTEVIIEDESKNINTTKNNSRRKRITYLLRQVIHKRAFCNCLSLNKARFFLGNLEEIDDNAFMNCSSLNTIEINSKYGKSLFTRDMTAFIRCPKELKVIFFNNNNKSVIQIYKIVKKFQQNTEKHHFGNHLSFLNKEFLV